MIMKHLIPFLASLAFALWTYVLLSYQKRLIHQKLNGPDVKLKIEEKMDGLIGRIIPDLALPFLPPALMGKLKEKGSSEIVKLLPEVNQEIDRQFKKYLFKIVALAALIGLMLGFFGAFAACPECYH